MTVRTGTVLLESQETIKVLLQTFSNPQIAPRDLRSREQRFQLVSNIMLVSMKPIFQICLRNEVI